MCVCVCAHMHSYAITLQLLIGNLPYNTQAMYCKQYFSMCVSAPAVIGMHCTHYSFKASSLISAAVAAVVILSAVKTKSYAPSSTQVQLTICKR